MALRPRHLLLPGLGFVAGVLAMLASGPGQPPPGAPPARAIALAPSPYATAIAAAAPSVVQVLATRPGKGMSGDADPAPGGLSRGSGVVIDAGGLILTNAHVIAGADGVAVNLADRRHLPARVLGTDAAMDLALLAVDAAGLTAATPGDARRLAPGDVVLTLGHPWGLGQTAGVGIVGATGRRAPELGPGTDLQLATRAEFIQTDAAINPGSSGGALLDTSGRLLGISTAAISGSGQAEGVGLAIPADRALAVAGRLAAAAGRPRGWLGIDGAALSPALSRRFALRAPRGVFVAAVAPQSPAALAGLRAGDVISAIDDMPLTDTIQLSRRLGGRLGERVDLEVWRGSERLRLEATLGGPPTAAGTIDDPPARHLAHPGHACAADTRSGC